MLFRKKKKKTLENSKSTDYSELVPEYFELIQQSVKCIMESRKERQLNSSAVHQIAYFVLIARILRKFDIISNKEKITILSVYSLHIEQELKDDYSSVLSQFETLYEKCFSDSQFAVALQHYAFSVEMYINKNVSDSYLSNSIECVIENISFLLKSIYET